MSIHDIFGANHETVCADYWKTQDGPLEWPRSTAREGTAIVVCKINYIHNEMFSSDKVAATVIK
jgi:hypothetical protein